MLNNKSFGMPLETLEGLAEGYADKESQSFEEEVYAAHILAVSVIALVESADINETEYAVSALNKLYKKNDVSRGLPYHR